MSGTLRLRGSTSGYSELQAPAVAADQTFVLPTAGGTLLTTDSPVPKLTLELGSASQPSLTFQGDTDTGLFSEGTNTLNLVTGGSSKVVLGAAAHTIYAGTGATVRAIDIDSAGRVGIGTSSPGETLHVNGTATAIKIDSNGDAALRFATSGTNKFSIYHTSGGTLNFFDNTNSQNRLRIDSSGSLLVNTSTSIGQDATTQIRNDSNGYNLSLQRSTDTTNPARLLAETSRGTVGTPTALEEDDGIWEGRFVGYDGGGYQQSSTIQAAVDGSVSNVNNSVPGRLVFSTTSVGDSSPSEAMRIDSAGQVSFRNPQPNVSLDISPPVSTVTCRVQARNTTTPTARLQLMRGANTTFGADDKTDWQIENSTSGQLNFISGHNTVGINQRLRLETDGKVTVGPPDTVYALFNIVQSNSGASFPSTTVATEPAGPSIDLINTSGATGSGSSINAVGSGTKGRYASISFFDSTSDNSGTGGGIVFATSSSKTGNLIERCRILPTGGLTFNGDTAQDNALRDYEQGNWSPEVFFGGSDTGVTYSEQSGTYVKVGNFVWASAVVQLSNNGSGTGNFEISLPFAVGGNAQHRGNGVFSFCNNFTGLTQIPHTYASGSGLTKMQVLQVNSAGTGHENLDQTNVGNTAQFRAFIGYMTF